MAVQPGSKFKTLLTGNEQINIDDGASVELRTTTRDVANLASLGAITTLFTLDADMNTLADQAFVQAFQFTQYIITQLIVTLARTSLSMAVGGIYTGPAKSGVHVVDNTQVYSALVAPNDVLILEPTVAGTKLMTALQLFLSLTTPQGIAARAGIYLMGVASA